MTAKLLAAILAGAFCCAAHAQAPAGSTALCKDGTYSTKPLKSGACTGHKGVRRMIVAEGATRTTKDTYSGTSTPPATAHNQPKTTPSTTAPASSPEPIASPAPKQQ